MRNESGHVVIVDGYSSGTGYLPLLLEAGVPAVHVRSTPETLDAAITAIARHSLEGCGKRYAALLDGSGDLDALCRELEGWKPRAVIAGCETGVELADALAGRLGLPGNDPATSALRRDKHEMHRALARAGLRFLDGFLTGGWDELLVWLDRNGLPVVLKPPRSAAADGVHICRTMDEVRAAFQTLLGSRSMFGDPVTAVLAQEFAPGREVVVNTVSLDGRHVVSDLWGYAKQITSQGRSVYDGVELLRDFGEDTEAALGYALKSLDALGVRVGPAHLEIMLTLDGPVLIECGARPMGGSFPQELIKECLGRTQLELALEAYLWPERFLARLDQPYRMSKGLYSKFLISSRKGRLDAVPGVTLLASLPSARSGNFISCLEGEQVDCTVDLMSSPATLFLCHEDAETLRQDRDILRELESEGQNLLFEMAAADIEHPVPDWFLRLPDEVWLKPESAGEADADLIWRALDLKPGQELLDCPCGDGRVSLHLARRGARVTGVDINPRFIERARERFAAEGLEAEFTVADMRALPFAKRFDALNNWFNSFGYFDVETDFEVLRGFARALKPGGTLLVEAPNRTNVIANTVRKFDAQGRELPKSWDETTERMRLPIQARVGDQLIESHAGPRLYSLAQYRLLFRLAKLELVKVLDEHLELSTPRSKRVIMVARKAGEFS